MLGDWFGIFLIRTGTKRNKQFVKKGARNWFAWSSYRKWQTTHISQLCGGAWLMVQLASTLASLCLSQRRPFWTYVMTVNLFPLYLMNFMFHTMLDAAGIVLRGHYKSMKCDVLFSHGSIRTLFRRRGHFFIHVQKISSSLQQCKV